MFFRKRLQRDARKEATGFIPLSQIRTMGVVLDRSGKEMEEGRDEIRKFCKTNKIELTLLYVDFGDSGNTGDENTICRRDLNLFGYPSTEKAGTFLGKRFDCFICLSDSDRFCIEYLAKAADARFKLGLKNDAVYDIIVTLPKNAPQDKYSQKDIFLTMKNIMSKIR